MVGRDGKEDEIKELQQYLPPKRKEGEELNRQQLLSLAAVGIVTPAFIEIASNLFFWWIREILRLEKEDRNRKPIDICKKLGIEEDDFEIWKDSQYRLLRHITTIRRLFVTPRDMWGDWLSVPQDRKAFCADYIMELTPGRLDTTVEPYARDFIENKGIDCPEKMLEVFHRKGGQYEDCVISLSESIRGLGLHRRTASYIIQMTIISVMAGGVPSQYNEIRALKGHGVKIAAVVMYEVFGKVCDIPVDTHMIKAFNALGWANASSGDAVSRQVAMVVPEEHHGRLNETFAGLGQILQTAGGERDELIAELLDVPREDRWMLEPIKALLAEYKITIE